MNYSKYFLLMLSVSSMIGCMDGEGRWGGEWGEFSLMAQRDREDFQLIDEQKAAKAEMQPINTCAALKSYLGCVVAYEPADRLGSGYQLVEFSSALSYGLIQDPLIPIQVQGGYTMAKLIRSSDHPGATNLTDSLLANAGLSLRRVTATEIVLIRRVLCAGHARFDCVDTADACALLDRLKK
jgi:hypothetical protein